MSIEAPPLERKLVAILAADVEGYSRMMHADEESTLVTLSSHRSVIDRLIAEYSGNITNTAGDSVLAEFPSVIEAVKCAVAIQTELGAANANLTADRQMQFRVGINVGDVMVKDGGIFGDGVNVAARVEALATPGGICITRGVRDYVRDRVPYRFDDLGDHSVKNIARSVHVFRVIYNETESEAKSDPSVSQAILETIKPVAENSVDDVELTFWKSVETGNNPEEYHAYLDRFPEGMFVELARSRIASPPAASKTTPVDQTVELTFWDAVKDSADPEMLQAYLTKYPEGEFASLAELLIRKSGVSA